MLSSSIAAETHVKVRSNEIKYSPHAFENLYDKIISDIETRPCALVILHIMYIIYQWVTVHTSDFIMVIRQSIYSPNHYKGDG